MNDLAELGGFIRFGNDSAETEILISAHGRVRGITAGNDRVNGWIDLDELFERFLAAHSARQSEIENDRIDALAGLEFFPINIDAVQCGRGLQHFVAEMGKGEINQGPDRFLIVHDQNSACAVDGVVIGPTCSDRQVLMERGRKIDGEGGAVMQFRFDRDQSIVILDDRIGGGQAEPGSFRFGREIRIENTFQIIFRNANAFIAYGDPDIIARGQVGNDRPVGRRIGEVIAAHPQRAAVRHGLIGVNHEIANHLADLARIDLRRPKIRAERKFAAAVTAAK